MSRHSGVGQRVGVHRSRGAIRRPWWFWLLVWVAAVAVLTGAGILALQALGGDFGPREPQEVITPVTDPAEAPEGTTVAVLNAADDEATASVVMERIEAAGWEPGIFGNAEEPLDRTVIFYADPEHREAALGVAQLLGVDAVVASDADLSGASITVAVGKDAVSLGLDQN